MDSDTVAKALVTIVDLMERILRLEERLVGMEERLTRAERAPGDALQVTTPFVPYTPYTDDACAGKWVPELYEGVLYGCGMDPDACVETSEL